MACKAFLLSVLCCCDDTNRMESISPEEASAAPSNSMEPTSPEEVSAAPSNSASYTYASKLASWEVEHLVEHHEVYDTPWLLPKHKIFISHSGAQKPFADQLCKDLENHGYYPFFDKRNDSLPKGEKFPPLIFNAAKECLLAIVLLSEEFFTRTKWPMLELAAFVEAQGKHNNDLRILPVLLGLTVGDLVKRTEEWLTVWNEWGRKDKHLTIKVITEWKAAIKALKPVNMILNCSCDGEVKLREVIIESVHKMMPPDIRSDVLYVQGREHLCKAVHSMFGKIPASISSWPCENAKVIGVYGIGGAGKSTLCMIVAEHVRSDFSGRVCVVEFGKETSTVNLQRQVLRQLCRDDELYLERISTENEGLNRLRERLCRERVFLALDNVPDDVASINIAKSFLKLKFHPNSMVLVTSRSHDVLYRSLGISDGSCMCCPSITKEDALQILLEQVNLTLELLDTEQTQVLHQAVELSFFNGYHPFALILFAAQLGMDQSKWREIKLDLQWTSDQEHPLFSKIETNYKRLPDQHTKDIFMDIALFTPQLLRGIKNIIWWLTDTYINLDVDDIKQKLGILKIKSLLERWKMEDETFRIHDLYRMFAERNASVDNDVPRYMYQRGGKVAPSVLVDNDRARMVQRAAFVEAKFEMLGLEACRNLQVLSARRCEKLRALCILRLGSLVSLELAECAALETLDLSGSGNLKWLHVSSCENLMKLDASELEFLRDVRVSKCSMLEDLNFKNCHMVKSVVILDNARLCHVHLGSGRSLNCLELYLCRSLTDIEISGVAYLTTIKKEVCPQVRAMRGGDIMCRDLKYMSIHKWGKLSATFVRGLEVSASLGVLDIRESLISRLPDLRACMSLQKLILIEVGVLLESNNEELLEEYEKILSISVEDVELPISLEVMRIESCRNVVVKEMMGKVQGLRNLKELILEEVGVGWDWEGNVQMKIEAARPLFIEMWEEVNAKQLLSLPFSQCGRLMYLDIDKCRLTNPRGQLSREWICEIKDVNNNQVSDEYSQVTFGHMRFSRRGALGVFSIYLEKMGRSKDQIQDFLNLPKFMGRLVTKEIRNTLATAFKAHRQSH